MPLVQGHYKRMESHGNGGGDKVRAGEIQDQGNVAGSTGKLDHMGGHSQNISQLGRLVEDPVSQTQFPTYGDLSHPALPQIPPSAGWQGRELPPLQRHQC